MLSLKHLRSAAWVPVSLMASTPRVFCILMERIMLCRAADDVNVRLARSIAFCKGTIAKTCWRIRLSLCKSPADSETPRRLPHATYVLLRPPVELRVARTTAKIPCSLRRSRLRWRCRRLFVRLGSRPQRNGTAGTLSYRPDSPRDFSSATAVRTHSLTDFWPHGRENTSG